MFVFRTWMVTVVVAGSFGVVQTAAAQSNASDGTSRGPRARHLTETAASAARSGDCARVRELAATVRELEPEVYRAVFVTNRDIATCGPLDGAAGAAAPSSPETPEPEPESLPVRRGLMLGVGASIGKVAHVEANLGWMVTPWLAVFGTTLAGGKIYDGDTAQTYRVYGAGVRAWPLRAIFLDVRVGGAKNKFTSYDEFNGGARHITHDRGLACLAEIGVEGMLGRFSADIHLGYGRFASISGIFAGVGVSFY